MRWLEQAWSRISVLHLALWPLSLVFGEVVALRRALYVMGLLKTVRLPVPVIIVGNITVGGTGKTPLVCWLTDFLRRHGRTPGIILRGYGRHSNDVRPALIDSDPTEVGDEAVLLARRANHPVWVGKRRAQAALRLLATHPDCDVIVSDDGLQHYALSRDIEIAVLDGKSGFGNGMLLPAGPLREPSNRLATVDAIIINGPLLFAHDDLPIGPLLEMHLIGSVFHNLLNPNQCVGPEYFLQRRVHAVAGIGNPRRFFEHLTNLGISFTSHPFPDHYEYNSDDFVAFTSAGNSDAIILTEKDAVKCERFCSEHFWVLQVDAQIEDSFGEWILRKLENSI